ncbi:hypothetical protein JXB12_03680, partial [candidate division KSB1 bacterium]|nr:hypothetical protein [candidate division KSB1 bacterium]
MKITTRITFLLVFMIMSIINGCGEKMPLPVVESNPDAFGANDTSYIHINPDWSATSLGYSGVSSTFTPVDIVIGTDDYIFIADQANDRIAVIARSGDIVSDQNLNQIEPLNNPIAMDIDQKLNLLIANGSHEIFCWNQYINNIGVDSVMVGIREDSTLIFSGEESKIDSIMGIYSFYTDTKANSSFQGITFGPAADNEVFVTDNGNNRIARLTLVMTGLVRLKNHFYHPIFTAVYERDIATFGSGAGTVDDPRSITCDKDGNIYFTQMGGNFKVQKLAKQGDNYLSAYTLYEDPIMDLNRFGAPLDIAIGSNDDIFVLDA